MNPERAVAKLLEEEWSDEDLKAYIRQIEVPSERERLRVFKRQATGYIKWISKDEEGSTLDPEDVRIIRHAKNFQDIISVLQKYESPELTFLSMVRQGYF